MLRTLAIWLGIGALGLAGLAPQAALAPLALTADGPAAAPKADRGWIGLMLSKDAGPTTVASVFPGGPAAFAGVRTGDVLTEVGGQPVAGHDPAAAAIESSAPGSNLTLTLLRGGKPLKLTAHVGSLREFHARYAHEMLRRDPRHPGFAVNHGVSQSDVAVELTRRLFEQNQRLEYALNDLHREVQSLRKELQAQKR